MREYGRQRRTTRIEGGTGQEVGEPGEDRIGYRKGRPVGGDAFNREKRDQ